MPKSSTSSQSYRKFTIHSSKFSPKITKLLLETLITLDWSNGVENICNELRQITQTELDGKYIWMIGSKPTYFIQYQVDSYAIIKGYNKIIFVWKPKYLEYPSIFKLTHFGDQPKQIKSMQIITQENLGQLSEFLQTQIITFLKNYYGFHYFNTEQTKFQINMLTQLKHLVSRTSRQSYWHCVMDDHNNFQVTAKNNLYLKLRIKGIKDKYDKDIIIFSKQGQRQFVIKGKIIQIISFIAMLIIFLAVINCPSENDTGLCYYKNQMIVAGTAVMMALMGIKLITRKKQKKKIDHTIQQLEKQIKKQ